MRRNVERDARATETATSLGWKVVRVWECQVNQDPSGYADLVLAGIQPASPFR
jgi:G:T-mismatch repair DNA endonuclease (very short patch repair protein)